MPSIKKIPAKLHYKLTSLKYQRKVLFTDYCNQLRYFLIFVGNSRSGTTLVRSLLDAHPNVIVGNEVNILDCITKGVSWAQGINKILVNSELFSKKPFWTGYSYQVSSLGRQPSDLHVVGDKKARITTTLLSQDMSRLDQLIQWSPIPVRVLHCIRHPFDVITTKTRRTHTPLPYNINEYFKIEKVAASVFNKLDEQSCKRIYQEQLIENPVQVLRDLLGFLELSAEPNYLAACQSVIYDQPHKSRFDIDWTSETMGAVWGQSLEVEHLSYYLDQGKLFFDKA